jgi:hypothetical protein
MTNQEKTRNKVLKKIVRLIDSLEDENYHDESLFLMELKDFVEKEPEVGVDRLLLWITKYKWM